MKRQIFFLLERLKITPSERKTISGLLILLVLLGGLNLAMSPSVPFEDGHYLELEKQFAQRTALLQAKENKLMEQYYPNKSMHPQTVATDSIPADKSKNKSEEKPRQQTPKQRININTADQKTLLTLPGIGPAYASRIINYRDKHGGFTAIDELKKIRGIAQKRLDKLKPFIKLKDSK